MGVLLFVLREIGIETSLLVLKLTKTTLESQSITTSFQILIKY